MVQTPIKHQVILKSKESLLVQEVDRVAAALSFLEGHCSLTEEIIELAEALEEIAEIVVQSHESGIISSTQFLNYKNFLVAAAAALGITLAIFLATPNINAPKIPTVSAPTLSAPMEQINRDTTAKSLFATAKSPGSASIGAAEGNYRVKRDGSITHTKLWFGHDDPGNGVGNQGFCSDQGRGGKVEWGGDGSLEQQRDPEMADAACVKFLNQKIDTVKQKFREAGINPNVEEFVNGFDMYNQASPANAGRFAQKLKEVKASGASGTDAIATARTKTFFGEGIKKATGLFRACRNRVTPIFDEWECVHGDQERRSKEISKALDRTAPGSKNVALNFFSKLKNGAPLAPAVSDDEKLALSLENYFQQKGWVLARGEGEINLAHLRTGGNKARNTWDGWRVVFTFRQGRPIILGRWRETTKPGATAIAAATNGGAPFLREGQYRKTWMVGTHVGMSRRNPHEALLQVVPLTVYRDFNQNGVGDTRRTGLFGINIHGTMRTAPTVGGASFGCMVVVGTPDDPMKPQREFMKIIKSDSRYQANAAFLFDSAIVNMEDL